MKHLTIFTENNNLDPAITSEESTTGGVYLEVATDTAVAEANHDWGDNAPGHVSSGLRPSYHYRYTTSITCSYVEHIDRVGVSDKFD
ncbi:hypothetical protein Fmac_021053 [Flemingia macrophylla]|uniref:Uncharacterized protein n=1 Tax=Flemingia macrophylla TaxID=520843 RepID=A0ABD1LVT2_9FABA